MTEASASSAGHHAERAAALDAADPLAHLREHFDLPPGKTYLDGNSLGALPHRVKARVRRVVEQEWGQTLIGSWNSHHWIDLPVTVGEQIAPLLGAAPGQVICADSISVNLFKLLALALALRPGRPVILSQADNFPTDLYMAQGLETLLGDARCRLHSVAAADLAGALDEEVAVLLLTQVNFRDGSLHDMAALTARAHAVGALVLWDLAHSAGVVPVALDHWEVDMAVGCGYKFLNGGPGAPAFAYLAQRHQGTASQPLCGWMGHRRAFDFDPRYEPAQDARALLSGTPGIIGMAALSAALELYREVSVDSLRQKSLALTDYCIRRMDRSPALQALDLATPREPGSRGSQVSMIHPQAYAMAQALIAEDVIVDFRAPDILRLGMAPMYNRFADVERALATLEAVLVERRYEAPEYRHRQRVT
jgi:kynureninase